MPPIILAISLFFHICATVIWIGGIFLTLILVWPEVNRTLKDQPTLYPMLQRLRKRFTPYGNLALAVLIVTGLFQMSADSNYDGVLQFTNEWSRIILLKHIAIGGMIICGGVLQFGVSPALERATLLAERGKGNPAEWEKLRRREVRLTRINAALGILILAFSTYAATL
ncbi:MAG TPA: CopD family protein [Phototrophicaceae bacterium]|nr:CopD family protein [Phototrophicaceae bacterium]